MKESKPVDEVIEYLEQQSALQKNIILPSATATTFFCSPATGLFIAHLKRLFPVFNQGSISNDFPYYASAMD